MSVMPPEERWTSCLGIVEAVSVSTEGHFARVTLQPHGIKVDCRVHTVNPAVYFPLEEESEVLVIFPGGRVAAAVAIPAFFSTPEPVPASAVADPDKIHVQTTKGINVIGGAVAITGGTVDITGASVDIDALTCDIASGDAYVVRAGDLCSGGNHHRPPSGWAIPFIGPAECSTTVRAKD